jgi:hypothetical protein
MMPKIDQARITGRVLGADGRPVKVGTVELHNQTDDILDTVLVDDEGRYSFNLSPGMWTLRAWDVKGRRGEATADLKSGIDATVDITLEA